MLRMKMSMEDVRPDVVEEFEDKDGNVFNKRTFDDLKRQGLL
jgi:splicing factor 3A subunit 3